MTDWFRSVLFSLLVIIVLVSVLLPTSAFASDHAAIPDQEHPMTALPPLPLF